MRKRIKVNYLPELDQYSRLDQRLSILGTLESHVLDERNWDAYTYRPEVSFKMAYTALGLILLYSVAEEQLKATYHHVNDPVYKDSCVEFFLSFNGVQYYNFEFNALGTALVAYGKPRRRSYLPEERLKQLEVVPFLDAGIQGAKWQLFVRIPFALLEEEQVSVDKMTGRTCFANFYKCGDELLRPHYLSWNKIQYPVPNFHLPQFFGELLFL